MHTNTDIVSSVWPRGMKINRMLGAIMSCRVDSSTVVVSTIGVSCRCLRKCPHPVYSHIVEVHRPQTRFRVWIRGWASVGRHGDKQPPGPSTFVAGVG